ncbi:diacylglycerol/lipid kinase family protein [Adlercreutzia murintestinalis]|jgi:lipid kinase, YegS/Rv2252/BmrU family|uniref:diacylglycerol/lipid kinase family protein n=1 Tax=Adlercreutzia murintestinalis TaxID=2941325 RepID=UPI0020409B3B|nr:diacylglycerol kinase family protein [Adlercreutzia murintestinalis]
MSELGNTLLIANPVAQSGRGLAAAQRVWKLLSDQLGDSVSLAMTKSAHHAVDLAAGAANFDTVVAIGGDGVIHEVSNGLMALPNDDRPKLGLVPVGSGNDYAHMLGVSSDLRTACGQLLSAEALDADVGLVNGTFYVETLSFGLDAAIALDTMDRRKRTGKSGTPLYMASGFDQLMHHLDSLSYTVQFDDEEPVSGMSITFAVQLGKYYGGGFNICPDASLTDGLFDICIAHPPVGKLKAAVVFMMAKGGKHRKVKQIETRTASKVRIEFSEEPPAQVDGERIEGRVFDIDVVPHALRVLRPAP